MSEPLRLALFDFDGTLCAGNSLHLLLGHLLRTRRGRARVLFWGVRRRLRLASSRRFKNGVLGSLGDLSRDELGLLGREVYRDLLRPRLRAAGMEEMRRLRQDGHHLALVTGAFDFLVGPFCEELGLADCLCCQVERTGGGWALAGAEMLGADKPVAVQAHFAHRPIDWNGSVAYSDDFSDLPLLRLVGRPCLVGTPPAGRVGEAPAGLRQVRWDR